MQTKENEIFKQMLDWIYANTEAHNQADVARRSGLFEATISRVLNGRIKKVKQETLRKVNSAFDNVFNPAWLRGDSDVMLTADLQPSATHSDTDAPAGFPNMVNSPDLSSLVNAALAAKEETIESLKRELTTKDETVTALRDQLADKERYILALQQQLRELHTQEHPQKEISHGCSYHMGVAEPE